MTHAKKLTALILSFALILTAFLTVMPAAEAEAASSSYRTVTRTNQCINGYYLYIDSYDYLRAGKTSSPSAIAPDVSSAVTNGSYVYFTQTSGNYTKFWKRKLSGGSPVLIKTIKDPLNSSYVGGRCHLQTAYGGYLYFTKNPCTKSHTHDLLEGAYLYRLKISTGKVSRVSSKKFDQFGAGTGFGKYIVLKGYKSPTTGAVQGTIYLYNISSGKIKSIGSGYSLVQTTSKYVYYWRFNEGFSSYNAYLLKCRYNISTGRTTVVATG